MKELRFEEKGTWVRLDINGMKHIWDSNEKDYRRWPDNVSRSYAESLLEFSKNLPEKQRMEMFFHAKGIATKGKLYKVLFRNMDWPFSNEDLDYIEQTKKEAEVYFETGVASF